MNIDNVYHQLRADIVHLACDIASEEEFEVAIDLLREAMGIVEYHLGELVSEGYDRREADEG
jgi:hypothetical protein